MKDHLENLLAIALKFLKANGAMSNGYETYLKGTIQIRHYGGLDWHTPKCGKITGDAKDLLARALSDEMQEYVQKHNLTNIFHFATTDRGNVEVSYKVSAEASLI